jgi:outer membrane receptor protein involved in Fe transport
VSLAASAYHVDWSNIQQNVYLQHCGAQFTANLGKARSQGFDIQATARSARPSRWMARWPIPMPASPRT